MRPEDWLLDWQTSHKSLRRSAAQVRRGDQLGAEDLADYPQIPRPAWLARAATNDDLAEYALQASIRSAARANESLSRLQDKATSFLGTLMVVIPIGLASTALAVPDTMDIIRIAALLVAAVGDVLLLSAAVAAALASGLVIAGGLNVDRLDPDDTAPLAAMKATEADAWHFAAVLAMESGTRRAYDLVPGATSDVDWRGADWRKRSTLHRKRRAHLRVA